MANWEEKFPKPMSPSAESVFMLIYFRIDSMTKRKAIGTHLAICWFYFYGVSSSSLLCRTFKLFHEILIGTRAFHSQ